MRRIVALVLVGVGVAGLVLAAMLRFYATPRVVVAPLDQFSETVSVAEGATYLDVGELELAEDRTLVATRTVRGDVGAGTDDTAVWDVFVKIIDPDKPGSGEDQLVSATTDRVAFDRRSSEAVNCCDENVNGEPTAHEGIEYKFPFGAEQRTYQYFDTSLRRATDMEFVAEEEIDGLTVYRYEQRIEPTRITEIDVPGSLVGDEEPSLTLDRYYANTRTVWVEPTTGVIVRGAESQLSTLRDDTGRDRLTITEADLAFDDETVAAQADVARDGIAQARLVTTTGPLVLLVVGVIALGAGLVLALGGGSSGTGGRVAEPREPAYT